MTDEKNTNSPCRFCGEEGTRACGCWRAHRERQESADDLERIAAEDAEHMSPRKEVQIKHAMQRVADAS